jgi:hypothetical protein
MREKLAKNRKSKLQFYWHFRGLCFRKITSLSQKATFSMNCQEGL